MDQIPAYNRVSIRAVLVAEGEDPHPALAAAGIVDPVAIPVVIGDAADLGSGILGNGITPNLTGVLETTLEGEDDHASPGAGTTEPTTSSRQPSGTVTGTMPAAYGTQPLAPVRRRT